MRMYTNLHGKLTSTVCQWPVSRAQTGGFMAFNRTRLWPVWAYGSCWHNPILYKSQLASAKFSKHACRGCQHAADASS